MLRAAAFAGFLAAFWAAFDAAAPQLLGVLLDGLVWAVRHCETVAIEPRQRLVDVERWVCAGVGAFGWDVTFTPVGEGNLDWPSIIEAFRAMGTQWLIVEQDSCRRDAFDSIGSSLNYVRTLV